MSTKRRHKYKERTRGVLHSPKKSKKGELEPSKVDHNPKIDNVH
jgi:hypothetical protein